MNKAALDTAIAIHQSGDLDEAELLYENLLEEDPENPGLLHLLGIVNAQKGELEIALELTQKAIELDEMEASFYNSLANIYKSLGLNKESIETYYQAIELNPSGAHQTLNNLGNLLYVEEKFEEATKHYESSIRLKPDVADTHCNLGIVLAAQGKIEEAIAVLKSALELEPNHLSANMAFARLAHKKHDHETAIQHYQKCLEIDPMHLEAKHNLGAISLAEKNYSEAIRLFKKVLIFDPNHVETLSNLGTAYLETGALGEALHYYMRLSEIEANSEIYYNIGVIYMNKDQHQDAIAYFEQALASDPENISIYTNLGAIYLKLGKHSEAIKQYETILKLDPSHDEARYLLSALKQEKSDCEIAPFEYVQALFDQYAPYFDTHLNGQLDFKAPQALFKAVSEYLGTQSAEHQILDLGCGTGLCGERFKTLSKRLIGVDLSPKMIEAAETKNCYDELKTLAIEEALPLYQNMDLILASDVFTYIGNLQATFETVLLAMKNEGLFAFTTETNPDCKTKPGYYLQQSARFAHHPKYIKSLAKAVGFKTVICKNMILRTQNKQPLEGYLWILKK